MSAFIHDITKPLNNPMRQKKDNPQFFLGNAWAQVCSVKMCTLGPDFGIQNF